MAGGKGRVPIRPFSAQQHNILFIADDKPGVSAIRN